MNAERFMRYVEKLPDGCWKWTGGLTPKGYGKCGHEYKTVSAHVMSHLLFKGEVPEGKIIRHTCNVKRCVNPEHLLPGTYKENLEDVRIQYGRVGALPQISEDKIISIFRMRQNLCPAKDIAAVLALPIDYITGVMAGNIRKELKTTFEVEFGQIPKFHSGHKFTDEDRAEMIRLYTEENVSAAKIAAQFGTNYKYVWKLANKPLQRRGDI